MFLVIDRDDNDKELCLKFMRHQEQYERELSSRAGGSFDEKLIVGILCSYTATDSGDLPIRKEFQRKGLAEFPYCLVMNAGDRSLHDILSKGN